MVGAKIAPRPQIPTEWEKLAIVSLKCRETHVLEQLSLLRERLRHQRCTHAAFASAGLAEIVKMFHFHEMQNHTMRRMALEVKGMLERGR